MITYCWEKKESEIERMAYNLRQYTNAPIEPGVARIIRVPTTPGVTFKDPSQTSSTTRNLKFKKTTLTLLSASYLEKKLEK